MATQFQFDGKTIKIPGVYSNIKSGIKNPSIALPFGNILIIDTGSGAGYGGGAGVDGELAQDKKAIYEFDNIADFQDFAKGGLWWLLANPLFRPAGLGANGVSKIFFIKAATTTAASMQYNFFGDGNASISVSTPTSNGGTLNIKVTDEGVIGNGVLVNSPSTNNILTKGFAGKMSRGVIDTSKFVLTFYRGTYKGLDQNNLPFDGISAVNSAALVVAKSPEFNNIQTVIDWMNTSTTFKQHFTLVSSDVDGDGSVDQYDLIDNGNYKLATGGTESYTSSSLLDRVLTDVADLQVNFILSDEFGANAQSTNNDKLAAFIVETSVWKPELYIGGGDDVDTYTSQTLAAAKHFNNDSITIVHGAINKQSQLGLREYAALYQTVAVMAREAGLEPQVPITFKGIDVDGEVHQLNDKEVTQALDAGVVVVRLDNGSFDIVKGVNTLQANQFLVNDDGTISSKQIKRIARQLNNGIRVAAKAELLKAPNGVNRNTLSTLDVQKWTEGYLKRQQASPSVDNLILSFQDVVVTRTADAYQINYKFTPNSEISFLFFTGLIIGI